MHKGAAALLWGEPAHDASIAASNSSASGTFARISAEVSITISVAVHPRNREFRRRAASSRSNIGRTFRGQRRLHPVHAGRATCAVGASAAREGVDYDVGQGSVCRRRELTPNGRLQGGTALTTFARRVPARLPARHARGVRYGTVTVTWPQMVPAQALTVVVPAATPKTTPELVLSSVMVATAGLLEVQIAE